MAEAASADLAAATFTTGVTTGVSAVGTTSTRSARVLLPWLCDPKRRQLIAAAVRTGAELRQSGQAQVSEDHELAWAAGFFGGDGTVSASPATSGSPARYLRARIAQAGTEGEPEVLRRFKSAVGEVGSIRGPFMPQNPWSRQPQYAWQASGSTKVELILQRLWRWLDEAKRDQARRAIIAAREIGPHRPMPPAHELFELA